MLNLEMIFDPDAVEASVRMRYQPTVAPESLPMDWRIEWEERAAIMEYDGGLPREHAEAEALRDIVSRMNPTSPKRFVATASLKAVDPTIDPGPDR